MINVPQAAPETPTLPRASVAEIDRSCRWPAMTLILTGAAWLVAASLLSVLAAIKLHAPGMLADYSWLTYGRVQPAAWNAWVFGFATPTGLALAFWLTARLSGATLAGGGAIILGALVWHTGLFIGVLGILAGETTGFEGLEIPKFASPILLAGYLTMAPWVLVNFGRRREPEVFVSQWYVLGAVLGFPWVFATGHLLTSFLPLRGVLQTAAQAWYLQNLSLLWFGFLGLAVLFYLVPKLTARPVPSRNLALFGFWSLAAFGGFGGLTRYSGGPFPAWMLSLSVVTSVLLLFPAYAVAVNLAGPLRREWARCRGNLLARFAALALLAYLVVSVLGAVNALPSIRRFTQFTLVGLGLDQISLVGFWSAALLAGVYAMTPRLLGRDWPSRRLAQVHFGCLATAVFLFAAAYLVGGGIQGLALNDPELPFINVVRRVLPFASTGTLAYLALLAGSAALAGNLGRLLLACWRTSIQPATQRAVEPLTVAEVKA